MARTASLPILLAALTSLSTLPALYARQDAAPAELPALRDRRMDPGTGRHLAAWPPAIPFDHQRMVLTIDIPSMTEPKFSASMDLTAVAVGSARSVLPLMARSTITPTSITQDGAPASFRRDDATLLIDLPRTVKPGESTTLRIAYTAEKPGADGNGLIWLQPREATEARAARPGMVYSQGQTQWNSFWFPCHDFPNERLATELKVTVPDPYIVISNGALVSKQTADGRSTFHWKQDQPHPAYLVMMAVGQFDVVDVGGDTSARPGLWMPVYGPPGSADRLKDIFANTAEMVTFFERTFDEPYPWDKYAQVIVRNFRWGGMENTSATTLAEFAARGDRGSQDGLIAHELAHQWTGNLITCKSWEHLWLNEGWATYSEWLWTEHNQGRDAYLRKVRGNGARLTVGERNRLPLAAPMVTNAFTDPEVNFTKADNPYTKGAHVLHMLRVRLGDDVFFAGVRAYIDRHKFGHVETDDFRKVMEQLSGENLERFFWQWCRRPGTPRLNVTAEIDGANLVITARQVQNIDPANPAYDITLPIRITAADGTVSTSVLSFDTREGVLKLPTTTRPAKIQIDPDATLLARILFQSSLDAPVPQPEQPAAPEQPAVPPAVPAPAPAAPGSVR